MTSQLIKNQKKVYGPKYYKENGQEYRITAKVRHDDQCNNGHNSFSITADIDEKRGNRWVESSGGCLHDEVKKHFPELAPFIKWHLMSTDEPLHYVANTLYLAGNRDCWGLKKGEPRQWEKKITFNDFPVAFKFSKKFIEWIERSENRAKAYYGFYPLEVPHKDEKGYKFAPKYTFKGFSCEWYECPFDSLEEAQQFREAFRKPFSISSEPTSWGEGKEPDLEGARHCAIWPDATIEQLQNKELLLSRIPQLLADFQKDVESLGLIY